MLSSRLSTTAARKRELVGRAQRHRQDLTEAQSDLRVQVAAARERVRSQRWWLLGGALGSGLLFSRTLRRVRWVPFAMAAWRLWQRVRPR